MVQEQVVKTIIAITAVAGFLYPTAVFAYDYVGDNQANLSFYYDTTNASVYITGTFDCIDQMYDSEEYNITLYDEFYNEYYGTFTITGSNTAESTNISGLVGGENIIRVSTSNIFGISCGNTNASYNLNEPGFVGEPPVTLWTVAEEYPQQEEEQTQTTSTYVILSIASTTAIIENQMDLTSNNFVQTFATAYTLPAMSLIMMTIIWFIKKYTQTSTSSGDYLTEYENYRRNN